MCGLFTQAKKKPVQIESHRSTTATPSFAICSFLPKHPNTHELSWREQTSTAFRRGIHRESKLEMLLCTMYQGDGRAATHILCRERSPARLTLSWCLF